MMIKQENRSTKLETGGKQFDLEDRTLRFAKDVRVFIQKLPKNIILNQDYMQLTRSSGSVGANYLEANESLSHKDFLMRIRISKKEARETVYWLELLVVDERFNAELTTLIDEANQLIRILGTILTRSKES
jgi:four helix bundle protein